MICYALIRKRFDNKREMLGKLLDNVIAIPKIRSESYEALKNLHDTVYESIMSIKSIGISIDNWDALSVHILTYNLDQETIVHYECQLSDVKEPQSLKSFLNYIETRFMALQSANAKNSFEKKYNHSNFNQKSFKSFDKSTSDVMKKISFYNESHSVFKCSGFLSKSPRERYDFVKSKKLCVVCLGSHKISECRSSHKCKYFSKAHSSFLHFENKPTVQRSNVAMVESMNNESIHVQSTVSLHLKRSVLLATAMVGVYAKNGNKIMLSALLDQGSQSAFITECAAQTLSLHRQNIVATDSGIGVKIQTAKHAMSLAVFPRFESDFIMNTDAIVLSQLTRISHGTYDENDFNFVNNLALADPSFLQQSKIDLILGAAEYAQAIKSGLIKSEKHLIAQNTEFGWIMSGAINSDDPSLEIVTLVSNVELENTLKKFFAPEEFEVDEEISEEELYCENHFKNTTYQYSDGKFVVSLPFKNKIKIQIWVIQENVQLRHNCHLSVVFKKIIHFATNIPNKLKKQLISVTLRR